MSEFYKPVVIDNGTGFFNGTCRQFKVWMEAVNTSLKPYDLIIDNMTSKIMDATFRSFTFISASINWVIYKLTSIPNPLILSHTYISVAIIPNTYLAV